jgi:hypothetical protein
MSEKSEGQKMKVSSAAILSFLLGIVGFCVLVVIVFCGDALRLGGVPERPYYLTDLYGYGHLVSGVLLIAGVAAGIFAIEKVRSRQQGWKGMGLAVAGAVTGVFFLVFWFVWSPHSRFTARQRCAANLGVLAKCLLIYSGGENPYPAADKWCDSLLEGGYTVEGAFVCDGAGEGRCHYAINPNVGPMSSPRTVLLFETKGGWNQFGGPELVSTVNHRGDGCNVVFNDHHVEWVRPEEVAELDWEGKVPESRQERARAREFARELLEWVEYEGNPVFAGTGENTWDKNIRERGFIMREGEKYHMWYTGYNDELSDTKFLGYATSADGLEWTRYEGNPIFAERWVEDMFVVKYEGTYYMLAEGRGDIAHMLTSKDGVHWEDEGDLDVRYTSGQRLTPGPYGTPTVLIEGGVWYLFYERDDLHVWLAKSRDLEVWTNVQDEPVLSPGPADYDGKLIALDYIVKYEGRYYAYYHGIGAGPEGQEWGPWCANVAVSTDLVSWEKYPKNPIVVANSPILVHDGSVWRLYCMHPEVRVYFPKGF